MPSEQTGPLNDSPVIRPLEHLDPSLDHVPVDVFNALVDVVNDLYAAFADADARLKLGVDSVLRNEQ